MPPKRNDISGTGDWNRLYDAIKNRNELVSDGSGETYSPEEVIRRIRKVKSGAIKGNDLHEVINQVPRIGNLRKDVFQLIQSENLFKDWEDVYRSLEDDGKYESTGSGKEYKGEEVKRRIGKVRKEIEEGKPIDEATRYIPRGIREEIKPLLEFVPSKNRKEEQRIEEWADLLPDEKYYEFSAFRSYTSAGKEKIPPQGWKIHLSTDPEEGRKLVKTVVNNYLEENSIPHKVVKDIDSLENAMTGGQNGKFITIYPEVDKDKQYILDENGYQTFQENNEKFNKNSINNNVKNTKEIIKDLQNLLNRSEVGLEGGPKITSQNREEKQYGDTRIHFRYGTNKKNKYCVVHDKEGDRIKIKGLVGKEGEYVGGSYDSDKLEALEDLF